MGRNSVIFDCQQHFGQTLGGQFRKIKEILFIDDT